MFPVLSFEFLLSFSSIMVSGIVQGSVTGVGRGAPMKSDVNWSGCGVRSVTFVTEKDFLSRSSDRLWFFLLDNLRSEKKKFDFLIQVTCNKMKLENTFCGKDFNNCFTKFAVRQHFRRFQITLCMLGNMSSFCCCLLTFFQNLTF